jgi:ketosteroid isomerase-like protein
MSCTRKLLLLLAFLMPSMAATADTNNDIEKALDYYEEVWSEGDLAAIRGYYHPDFVLFTGGNSINLSQRMADLEVVMKPGEDHGELSYSGVTIRPLGDDHAMAFGQFKLSFKDGTHLESWFTTVYEKTPFGWKALMTQS